MKHFTFDNDWDEIKGRLKERFHQLTDEDLAYVEGQASALLARLREKLGITAKDLDALLQELREAAEGRFERAKAKAGEFAHELREKADTMAGDLKTQAGVAYDQARDRARGLREEGEEYVRKNPRESLLAAVCAGFVAGMLIRH